MTSTHEANKLTTPPWLHWSLFLILDIVTRGFFEMVWLVVLTNWVRKVRGRSAAFWWSIAFASFMPGLFLMVFVGAIICILLGKPVKPSVEWIVCFWMIGLVMTRIFAIFTLRGELTQKPIFLHTGYWMTILFGVVHLQYKLGRFSNKLKAAHSSAIEAPVKVRGTDQL